MANQWVIEILTVGDDPVVFRPDVPEARFGDPLRAQPFDLVVWSNRTDLDLRIESIPPGQTLLDQDLAAGSTSRNQFVVPGDSQTIEYRCTNPQVKHSIEVEGGST
jgi:hypothetical protein